MEIGRFSCHMRYVCNYACVLILINISTFIIIKSSHLAYIFIFDVSPETDSPFFGTIRNLCRFQFKVLMLLLSVESICDCLSDFGHTLTLLFKIVVRDLYCKCLVILIMDSFDCWDLKDAYTNIHTKFISLPLLIINRFIVFIEK